VAAPDESEEVERLRARLTVLEEQRFELHARTNARVAAAQDRAYWLERWGLDLDAVLRHRVLRAALRPWRR
jgi:hypothetical protein